MVSIVENWAMIIGIVIGMTPAEPGHKFATLIMEIERIEKIENYPMLLQQKPGDRIKVQVRPSQIEAVPCILNSTISIRVRRGQDPEIVFAATDWTPDISTDGTK